MANSADPDQVWMYTVCKGRVYLGSAGQGLTLSGAVKCLKGLNIFFHISWPVHHRLVFPC